MQRVVFNANYFVYCDDVVDLWTRVALAPELAAAGDSTNLHSIGFDFMLKSTTLVITTSMTSTTGNTKPREAGRERTGDMEILKTAIARRASGR